MASKHVIPASITHINQIKRNMRVADREEIWASHMLEPGHALYLSLMSSDLAWTVLSPATKEPFAMFGARKGTSLNPLGRVWMLATDEIEAWKLVFAKHSRDYMSFMVNLLGDLSNHVDARNKVSIAWLKWLGAEFDAPAPHGVEGRDFQRFIMRRF